jgi:hypothetical protein
MRQQTFKSQSGVPLFLGQICFLSINDALVLPREEVLNFSAFTLFSLHCKSGKKSLDEPALMSQAGLNSGAAFDWERVTMAGISNA